MNTRVVVLDEVQKLIEELPERERDLIIEKLELLEVFPLMYPLRDKGRFRRHRRIVAGNRLVYYRVVDNTVYIRGLWPARIP